MKKNKQMEELKDLVRLLDALNEDAEKFYIKENNTAGGRLRKGLKELKTKTEEIRKSILARVKENKK